MDRATTAVLQRLRRGPASTVELQAELYATHVPKQIFDLRREGFFIKTTRLPNGVALYTLLGLVLDVPVEAEIPRSGSVVALRSGSSGSASTGVPVFGDVAAIREMRSASGSWSRREANRR
jgi:hypothetical protein